MIGKLHCAKPNYKRTGMPILIADKIDGSTKIFPMIFHSNESSIYQKDMKILNPYVAYNKISKYMKQKLKYEIKKIDKPTIVVGGFNPFFG